MTVCRMSGRHPPCCGEIRNARSAANESASDAFTYVHSSLAPIHMTADSTQTATPPEKRSGSALLHAIILTSPGISGDGLWQMEVSLSDYKHATNYGMVSVCSSVCSSVCPPSGSVRPSVSLSEVHFAIMWKWRSSHLARWQGRAQQTTY
jgi:hypothetical protein